MNRFVGRVLIASVMVASLVSAEEPNVINPPSNDIKNSRTVGYLGPRLDLAPIYQGVGIGWRRPTVSGQGANDFAVYCNFLLWGLPKDVGIIPTLEYTYIAYNQNSVYLNARQYIGYGLGLFIAYPFFPIIPNPKISWGKEFDNGHFSEWSVNIIPAAVCAISVVAGGISVDNKWGYILASASLFLVIEYHYGF